jgi:AcrR family transcriptional regulator
MARGQAATSSRLSVDDWIRGGFAILAEEGIKALKIERLCRRLGVTKGSFYWHFTDFAAGIGLLHLAGREPDPEAGERRERFLDIMLSR